MTNAATQYAGLEVLAGPQDSVPSMLAEFRARRDLIVSGLNELPGVACLAGTAFGRYGEGHLRFSYANSKENITRALERMGEILSRRMAR